MCAAIRVLERAEASQRLRTSRAIQQNSAIQQKDRRLLLREHFFREEGPTPERVVLKLAWPEHLGPVEEARKKVRQRLDDLEGLARQQRKSEGRAVLGSAGVRRQDFRACSTTWEPRRTLRPRIAARNRWARVEALQRDRAFQEAYQVALKASVFFSLSRG